MHGWLTLLLQHDLNKPKQLNYSRTLHMLHWTIYSYWESLRMRLLLRFLFYGMWGMIISYIFIFLSYAKKRWLHISSRPVEDNGYSDIEAKALELWASPHMDVGFSSNLRFCNEIVTYIKNFWLGTAEWTGETTTTNNTKENDKIIIIKKKLQGQTLNVQNKALMETVHHTFGRWFLCHESTTNVVRLNRNGNPIYEMPIERFSRVWTILEAGEKTGSLK